MNIIRIILLIALMILLIRKKMTIGVVLLLSALITGLMFMGDYVDLPIVFINSIFSSLTLRLIIIIYSVFLMASLMKEYHLKRMLNGVMNLFPNLKAAMIVPPMIIGLLPMPGGAMLPAPIVDEIGDKLSISPEMKTYVNFWFRHIWEYSWPLYPGMILTASLLDIPIRLIVQYQFYLTFVALIMGIIVISRIPGVKNQRNMSLAHAAKDFFSGIWPILLIIILLLSSTLRTEYIVLFTVFIYWLSLKIRWRKKFIYLIKSMSLEALLLILGLVIFKEVLQESQALILFVDSFRHEAYLSVLIIIILPFIVGFLTGINQGYVGIALPVLIPLLMINGQVDMIKLVMFYASGFAGILISPAHLCLSLTKEYYKADLNKVYKYLIPSAIPILIIPVIIYIILR